MCFHSIHSARLSKALSRRCKSLKEIVIIIHEIGTIQSLFSIRWCEYLCYVLYIPNFHRHERGNTHEHGMPRPRMGKVNDLLFQVPRLTFSRFDPVVSCLFPHLSPHGNPDLRSRHHSSQHRSSRRLYPAHARHARIIGRFHPHRSAVSHRLP